MRNCKTSGEVSLSLEWWEGALNVGETRMRQGRIRFKGYSINDESTTQLDIKRLDLTEFAGLVNLQYYCHNHQKYREITQSC
jgi:hypothetical protein